MTEPVVFIWTMFDTDYGQTHHVQLSVFRKNFGVRYFGGGRDTFMGEMAMERLTHQFWRFIGAE